MSCSIGNAETHCRRRLTETLCREVYVLCHQMTESEYHSSSTMLAQEKQINGTCQGRKSALLQTLILKNIYLVMSTVQCYRKHQDLQISLKHKKSVIIWYIIQLISLSSPFACIIFSLLNFQLKTRVIQVWRVLHGTWVPAFVDLFYNFSHKSRKKER